VFRGKSGRSWPETANSNHEADNGHKHRDAKRVRAGVSSNCGALPVFACAANFDTMMRQARSFVKAYQAMNVEVVTCDLFVTRNHLKLRVKAKLLSP
jgi:hypothetical protein